MTTVEKQQPPAKVEAGYVRVVHLAHEGVYPLAGYTVLSAKMSLEEVFNISYFAEARVNGKHVTVDRRLRPGDVLSFCRRYGFKGAGDDRPVHKKEANGLLSNYPGLMDILCEVKGMGLNAPRSLDLMSRKVVEWMEAEFGPFTNRIVRDTAHELVKQLNAFEETGELPPPDGPTDSGGLWSEGVLFDTRLSPQQIRFVRALWKAKEIEHEVACEAVYRLDYTLYSGIDDVKREASRKLNKAGLKIRSVGGAIFCLIKMDD